jgi:GST-like protein
MLELYHWEPNANSAKVLICLKEKRLDFVSHYVDVLEFEQYAPAFLAMNPTGQVPVLIHNGEALIESTLINEYLAEAFPDVRLAPEDPKGWYDTQCWGKYVDYNLAPSVATLGWHKVMAPLMRKRDQDQLRQTVDWIAIEERQAAWRVAIDDAYSDDQLANSQRKIELAVKRIEATLAESPWLLGADYSIADIDAFALTQTLPRLLPEVVNRDNTPRTIDWLDRISARPAVRETLAMARSSEGPDAYAPGPEHSRWG